MRLHKLALLPLVALFLSCNDESAPVGPDGPEVRTRVDRNNDQPTRLAETYVRSSWLSPQDLANGSQAPEGGTEATQFAACDGSDWVLGGGYHIHNPVYNADFDRTKVRIVASFPKRFWPTSAGEWHDGWLVTAILTDPTANAGVSVWALCGRDQVSVGS
jgi:hypothetical protein